MCCMRNKTKAAVTINRLREKQEEWEGGGESGDFWGLHGSQGGNGDERRRDFPPLPFLQATNND